MADLSELLSEMIISSLKGSRIDITDILAYERDIELNALDKERPTIHSVLLVFE